MNMQVTCPVCGNTRDLPEGAEGKKWKCGKCTSVHRILKDEAGYALKTLEEAIYKAAAAEEPAMAMAAEAGEQRGKAPVGPRLTTKRDKFRSEQPPSRVTRGRSRRA